MSAGVRGSSPSSGVMNIWKPVGSSGFSNTIVLVPSPSSYSLTVRSEGEVSIPCKALAQDAEDPLAVEEVLERHHGIISEADKGTSPLEAWPRSALCGHCPRCR